MIRPYTQRQSSINPMGCSGRVSDLTCCLFTKIQVRRYFYVLCRRKTNLQFDGFTTRLITVRGTTDKIDLFSTFLYYLFRSSFQPDQVVLLYGTGGEQISGQKKLNMLAEDMAASLQNLSTVFVVPLEDMKNSRSWL